VIGSRVVQEPRYGAHPWLVDAWRAAGSSRTQWRLYYKLPPNDPRVLELTEEECIRDLLVIRYRRHLIDLELQPIETQSADATFRAAMMRMKKQASSPDHLAMVRRRIEAAKKEATATPEAPEIKRLALAPSKQDDPA
jgi:hypothetical protein